LTLGSQLVAAATDKSMGGQYAVEQDDSQAQRIEQGRDGDMEESTGQLEEILVTGSRIRGAKSASPMVTNTRQEIDRAGFATVESIVDKLPQNFGAGATQDTVTGRNTDTAVGGSVENMTSGTSINLRGLGTNSTLVLLNGRRLSPSGRSARFTDISGIPVTAIERVEVVTDGASAIYGSDAIGGVVNFILRNDYEGAATRLRYGSDDGGDTSEMLFGQSFGTSWDDGNFLASYEYYKHDGLANRDRDFAASQDLTRFGGDDFRVPGGNPASILSFADFQVYQIPRGQDGTSLTAADFDLNAPINLHDVRVHEDLLPEQERHSAFFYFSQDVGEAELFAEAGFSTRDNLNRIDQALVNEFVPATNPFFVDPSGLGSAGDFIVGYSLTDNVGPLISSGETNAIRLVLGATFDIGDAWEGELVGNWSKEKAIARVDNIVDTIAVASALNQSDPALALNLYGDGSAINQAVLDRLVTGRAIADAENDLWTAGLNIDGEVFNLPGGAVRVATGIEFREESLLSVVDSGPQQAVGDLSRDVIAFYAEVFFPLVSAGNSLPGLQRLEFSVAARHEDYSDFGDSTDPKAGVVWSPTQSLTVRGTYGTSFRAPALFDLDPNSPTNSIVYVPTAGPDPALVIQGANDTLTSEEARTWTTGFQWSPESIRGLSLDVTYFDIDFEDRIDRPFVSLVAGLNDPRFASLIDTMPTDEEIETLANDPRYLESVFGRTSPAADIISGLLPVNWILDARINNISRSEVTGVDYQLSYEFKTDLGLFDVGLNGSHMLDFKRALVAADPLVDEVDTLGRPVGFRARGDVTWSYQGWAVTGFVNYVDDYTDNVSVPERSIDSWATVDLTIAYDSGDNRGLLSDTRLSLTTQNLFDENPPFVNSFSGVGYDTAIASGLGRLISLQITKEW
jgi:outer membrane receptor protein involved in Fe transport